MSQYLFQKIVDEKVLGRFTTYRVSRWVDYAKNNCRDENAPAPVDHRRHTNPYISRFGDDWEEYCDKQALKNQVCITEYIDHMFETTKKFFDPNGGDKNEWWVYHDALSLMTANELIQYMIDKWDIMNTGFYRNVI